MEQASVIAEEYNDIIKMCLNGKINFSDLEDLYFPKFKKEKRFLRDDLYELINQAFGSIESETDDEEQLKTGLKYYQSEETIRAELSEISRGLDALKD